MNRAVQSRTWQAYLWRQRLIGRGDGRAESSEVPLNDKFRDLCEPDPGSVCVGEAVLVGGPGLKEGIGLGAA